MRDSNPIPVIYRVIQLPYTDTATQGKLNYKKGHRLKNITTGTIMQINFLTEKIKSLPRFGFAYSIKLGSRTGSVCYGSG